MSNRCKTAEMINIISSTVFQCFVVSLDSTAVYRIHPQLMFHLPHCDRVMCASFTCNSFSPILHVCGGGVHPVEASIELLCTLLTCSHSFPQYHQSPRIVFRRIPFASRKVPSSRKHENILHKPATSTPSEQIC